MAGNATQCQYYQHRDDLPPISHMDTIAIAVECFIGEVEGVGYILRGGGRRRGKEKKAEEEEEEEEEGEEEEVWWAVD